jgi:hypothetical protein
MASKKHTTKQLRFRIERMGETFVVIDTVECKYSEFASRKDAERECDARNGIFRQKTSEPAELRVLQEKFKKVGISIEEAHGFDQPRTKDIKAVRREAQIVGNYREWLPKLLSAMAVELAHQSGMEDTRRSMATHAVINAITDAADPDAADRKGFSFKTRRLRLLFDEFKIDWAHPRDNDLGWVLLIHYASAEPARLKAAYWGISERDYFRKLDAAHRSLAGSLAQRLGGADDSEWFSQDDIERYNAAPDSSPSDNDYWGLNTGDLDGFGVEKWPF